MRVLIVEDEESIRLVLQHYLRDGHLADVAVNGEQALEAFQLAHQESDPYRVILLDIIMPGMDGLDALKAIRSMEKRMGIPEDREVKVLMISAQNDHHCVCEAFFKGNASGYLVKPVERESLLECIGNFE